MIYEPSPFCYTKKKKRADQMDRAFIIGDIHGNYDELLQLLTHWDPATETLIFLGDYIDRGPDSLQVVRHVMQLVEEGAIALKGNHEEMMMEWTRGEHEARYLRNGGEETLQSFMTASSGANDLSFAEFRSVLLTEFSEEVTFLSERPLYYEWNQFLFVHAGVDLSKENWRDGTDEDFLWIREPFHTGSNQTGKKIVFGHTPVKILNRDKSFNPWFSECGTKIGIDGGLVFGGQLNGLKVAADGRTDWVKVESIS
ncbi:metallophosphoesterase family protein [Geomicrobium sp. JSM 1781026]|uniref:metallophosphoesterase family protein n=1 Tax=Geomicrobium sp. JSM 1781026 TaxID=3344580 RepID=UPI0035C09923